MKDFDEACLRKHLGDPLFVLAWADWLEERGDPRHAAVRALGPLGLRLAYDEATLTAWVWDVVLDAKDSARDLPAGMLSKVYDTFAGWVVTAKDPDELLDNVKVVVESLERQRRGGLTP